MHITNFINHHFQLCAILTTLVGQSLPKKPQELLIVKIFETLSLHCCATDHRNGQHFIIPQMADR